MPPDRLPNIARREHITPTHILRTPSSYVLPLQLQGIVPDCAQQCLTTYINQEYKCSRNGVSCLCQNYSSHGFTLGELAYICLHQDCEHASRSESLAQYNICSTVSGAVSATHSVLTAPATTRTNSFTSTTTKTTPSLQTTTVHLTSSTSGSGSHSRLHRANSLHTTGRSPTAVSKSPTGSGNSIKMDSSASGTRSGSPTTPTAAAASTTPSSVHSTRLTAPQAAGITIAALAVTALIIAAIYFFVCFRRRKTKQEDGQKSRDFANKAPRLLSPMLTIRPADDIRRFDRDTIRCWQQLATTPAQQRGENVDISPETTESYESTRSLSHLLPNKPAAAPLRQQPKTRSGSADTAATEFEEETAPLGPTWKGLGLPPSPQAMLDPSTKVRHPQQRPPAANKTLVSPDIRHLPPLSLEIPTSATRLPKVRPPAPVARPPLLIPRENSGDTERRKSTASRSRSRDSSVSLLNYYASSEAGVSASPVLVDSPAPMEPEIAKLPAIPSGIVVTRPTDPRPLTRKDSAASDTSFESTDPDEPTPPEEEKQLTPVQESPIAQRSPISDIRYPKIPRSANQTVPRSPGYGTLSPSSLQLPTEPQSMYESQKVYRAYSPRQNQQQSWPLPSTVTPDRQTSGKSTLSGSTLAAKRRGESAAHDLELKLNTEETSYTPFNKFNSPSGDADRHRPRNDPHSLRRESPLKGYGRVASSGRKASHGQHHPQRKSPRRRGPQEVTPRSPLWEPKLTPEKRGEDLYLQVGVATPMQANFRQ